MKKPDLLIALAVILLTAGTAHADLDAYLNSLTVNASADLGQFRAGLGAHFGASAPEIDLVLNTVSRRGDAALCFWLSNHTRQPMDVVLREYRAHKGQGWGVLAKSLGIKPGSEDFHALKRGDLGWYPDEDRRGHESKGKNGGKGNNKGNGKGKGKGKNK